MINTRKNVQRTIDAIAAVLPAGWGVRLAPMSEESLEVFHGGEPGGGVFVLWCREVTVVQPSVLPNGERRGPVGDRVKVGEYRGVRRIAQVAEGVLEGIRIFSERYAYALPTEKGEAQELPRPITFGIDEVEVMCRNIGYDITCGRCASVFFTGMALEDHDPGCKNCPPESTTTAAGAERVVGEQIKTIIDRVRELLAVATPRPWLASNDAEPVRIVSGMMAGYHRPGSRFVCGHEAGGHAHPVSPVDAELIAFAVNNLGTLCDALEDAERRVAEAEVQLETSRAEFAVLMDHSTRNIQILNDVATQVCCTYFERLPEVVRELVTGLHAAEAQTAVWREHTSALVAAMKTWGSWEDGVPDASDAGECGDVGRAFNAARDALAPDMNLKAWRCSACGETAAPMTSAWRWTGSIWQHTHTDASQAGHFDAVYVDPARALLDRLHAAEAERDEAMAVLEEIREFARMQSQGPAAPDDLWAIKEMADKLILRCAQLPGAAPAEAP